MALGVIRYVEEEEGEDHADGQEVAGHGVVASPTHPPADDQEAQAGDPLAVGADHLRRRRRVRLNDELVPQTHALNADGQGVVIVAAGQGVVVVGHGVDRLTADGHDAVTDEQTGPGRGTAVVQGDDLEPVHTEAGFGLLGDVDGHGQRASSSNAAAEPG